MPHFQNVIYTLFIGMIDLY